MRVPAIGDGCRPFAGHMHLPIRLRSHCVPKPSQSGHNDRDSGIVDISAHRCIVAHIVLETKLSKLRFKSFVLRQREDLNDGVDVIRSTWSLYSRICH